MSADRTHLIECCKEMRETGDLSYRHMTALAWMIAILMATGCTAKGNIEDPGHDALCTDHRTNEQFILRFDTIENVRYGVGAPSCYDVMDDDDRMRTMCSDMEPAITCADIPRSKK